MTALEKNGRIVTFEETGSGEPVLCVHGSFAASTAWRRVVEAMDSEKFRAIAVDLPGCGGSTAPTVDSSLLGQEVLAVETVAEEAIREPIHLVGHSYGGVVCLAVSLANNARLKSLTLFEPLPLAFLSDTGDTQALGQMTEFVADYRYAFEAGEEWACSRVVNLWGGEGTFESMPENVRRTMASATATNIRQWEDNLAFRPTLDAYRALSVPTNLVVGEHAHPISRLMTQRLSELIPDNRVVELKGAGHFMIHTHGVECARVLGD